MATDSEKSISRNPESENPKKTLNPPNLTDESKDPKLEKPQSQSQSQLDEVTPDEGTDKKEEANDSTAKGTNSSVVSPTAPDGGGAANDIQKKLRRAERFGVPVQLSEEEKRNSRAERFGTVSGSEVSKSSEEQKRKARAERFGLSVASDDESKKKARLARFGSEAKIDTQEEEKRKARAIRFSQSGTNTVPHINHEGDVGQKTAIAGDANGGA